MPNTHMPPTTSQQATGIEDRNSLFADRSFWGMTFTQFLGAFNDNLYKQLMLLLAVPIAVAAAGAPNAGEDVQGWATLVFSLPFVLLSGLTGFLSDKFSKQVIIVYCKVAEIVVMLLGMLAFIYYDILGDVGTWTVLFFMGTHSAFFGPGKYGILPELFRSKDLARANGLILMTTFLAIIFGTVLAGVLGDLLLTADANGNVSAKPLWIGSLVCIGIALLGTMTSLLVRRTKRAQPNAVLKAEDLGISGDVRRMLWFDRPLLAALLVSCVFWMVSGMAVPTINRLGLGQLAVNKTMTSVLVAAIGTGIMLGSIFAGLFLKKVSPKRQVTWGLWGIVLTLALMGCWTPGGNQLIGFYGSVFVLLLLGSAAAMYAIPLQVFMQHRPPATLKGRMIATMNQANFVGILLAGPFYQFFEFIARSIGWPISSIFWMIGLFVLPLAIFYRLGESKAEPPAITD